MYNIAHSQEYPFYNYNSDAASIILSIHDIRLYLTLPVNIVSSRDSFLSLLSLRLLYFLGTELHFKLLVSKTTITGVTSALLSDSIVYDTQTHTWSGDIVNSGSYITFLKDLLSALTAIQCNADVYPECLIISYSRPKLRLYQMPILSTAVLTSDWRNVKNNTLLDQLNFCATGTNLLITYNNNLVLIIAGQGLGSGLQSDAGVWSDIKKADFIESVNSGILNINGITGNLLLDFGAYVHATTKTDLSACTVNITRLKVTNE